MLFRFSYFFTSVLVTCISFLFLTSSSYSVIQITSLFSWLRLYNFCNFVDSTNNVEYCEGRYSCVVCPSVRLSVCRCDKLKSLDGINKPRHFAETDTNAFVLKQHCIRQGPGPHGKMIGGAKFPVKICIASCDQPDTGSRAIPPTPKRLYHYKI